MMLSSGLSRFGIIALSLLLLPALGCSSSSPTAATGGTLRITMKDAPTDELSAVNVYISGLTVKASGMPVETVPVTITPNPVDLMSIVNDPVQLAVANVDPGDYEFIQIELDPSQSSVTPIGGGNLPVVMPSTEIKVLGTFTVDANHETTVTLDFNADQSLVHRGDGTWLLQPVIAIDHVSQQ
jgi:hypothetical protein